MTWGHIFSGRKSRDQKEREQRLAEAELEVARLRERAEKVAESLTRRLARNHWGETVQAIARKEH